jgi:hypothetical protein
MPDLFDSSLSKEEEQWQSRRYTKQQIAENVAPQVLHATSPAFGKDQQPEDD